MRRAQLRTTHPMMGFLSLPTHASSGVKNGNFLVELLRGKLFTVYNGTHSPVKLSNTILQSLGALMKTAGSFRAPGPHV